MKKALSVVLVFVTVFALLSVLPSCSDKEKAEPPKFDILESDVTLDVDKVSLESLRDFSNVTIECTRMDLEGNEIKDTYNSDRLSFFSRSVVVTEDAIFRFYEVLFMADSSFGDEGYSPVVIGGFAECYIPKYKIKDLTLSGDGVKIERAYRGECSRLGISTVAKLHHEALKKNVKPSGDGCYSYIYCIDGVPNNPSVNDDNTGCYEFFENGYPITITKTKEEYDQSITSLAYLIWFNRGSDISIFEN